LAALWFSYVAAEVGIFRGMIPLSASVLVMCCMLIKTPASDEKSDKLIWPVLLLAAAACWWSWPPGHIMQSYWDPAMYVQSGTVLAREGGITFDLSAFQALPTGVQSMVSLPSLQPVPYAGVILREDGQAVPLFFHLFNCWVAVMYSLGGIDLALAANIPLYALSIILVFVLVRRWFGGPWALFCAVLFALAPAQLWQSRFPTSELLTQVLLLGGFIYLDRAFEKTTAWRPVDAIIAGVSFGLAFMTRVDSILVIGPLLILLSGFLFTPSGKNVRWIIIAMLLPVMHALIHVKVIGSTYFPRPEIIVPSIIIVLIVMTIQLGLSWKRRDKNPIGFPFSTGWTVVVALLWLAWIVWAWQIRPRLMLDGNVAHMVENFLGTGSQARWYAILSGRDSWNMMMLQKLNGWPIILFSSLGATVLLFRKSEKPALRIWLFVSMFVTICLVTSLHHERAMMWMTRRFIPVIIPFLVISATVLCWYVWTAVKMPRSVRITCSLAFAGLLLSGMTKPLQKVWSMREFYGTKVGFEALADVLNRDAIVFSDVTGVGASLRMIYGFEAYELNEPSLDRRYQLMDHILNMPTNRPVLYVTPVPVEPVHESRMRLYDKIDFSAMVYDQSRIEIPSQFQQLKSPFYIYEITGTATQP